MELSFRFRRRSANLRRKEIATPKTGCDTTKNTRVERSLLLIAIAILAIAILRYNIFLSRTFHAV